ncbi:MAG: tRNA (adenosine(37)-N6)-threonylcarbamoyltransferase complex dimerization subunit type 1 TsaB [Treponema sp.]|nr:tRNA (adenosine(37)-N6)-threonylcarbamoyltransferase complex dimerization subunit type 1 TsaB [Treponema sp.]
MNALAVDSAASRMVIAAKKDDDVATLSLDIAMKQSEKILPAIDFVLSEVGLTPADLDYTAICKGPGTFTGLRLGFSALKALTLSNNIPLYAVPTLEAYAFPFAEFAGAVVSVIDAKKDQFFASVYRGGKCCMPPKDTDTTEILKNLDAEESVLIVGQNADVFAENLRSLAPTLDVRCYKSQPAATSALFTLAEQMIAQKEPPLADYDGPDYMRKSEAEIAAEAKA